MEPETAVSLIGDITFQPGWTIDAETSNRYESAVLLDISWPAPNFNREFAPEYDQMLRPAAAFTLLVKDMDDMDLYRAVIDKLIYCMTHDAREAFRIGSALWAPFHPHRVDSMKRWGTPESDLTFGLA